MKKLNVAILGQGRSGRDIHGACLKHMTDQFAVAAVVDPLQDRRVRAGQEYGCKTFADYTELPGPGDIDIVVNATPSHLHVPISLALLKKGYNVLCEKPLARKAAEVDKLLRASEESGRLLAIFQQSRYAPYFRQVRRVIGSGALGRIVQINLAFNGFQRRWDWQCLQEYNGGSLLNTGPHPLDQALQLLACEGMPEVFCHMDRVNTFGDAEDHVKLLLRAPGRPVIDMEVSCCCAYPSFTYSVYGAHGGLKGSTNSIDWKYYVPAETPAQHLIREPLRNPDGTPAYCSELLTMHEEHWDLAQEPPEAADMTHSFYSMLYETLANGAPLEITPAQVRQQIAVMEECHRQNPLSRLDA